MKRVSYTAEFKDETVKQVIEWGHGVVEAASRLGVLNTKLYLGVRHSKERQGMGSGEAASLKGKSSQLKVTLERFTGDGRSHRLSLPETLKNCSRSTTLGLLP